MNNDRRLPNTGLDVAKDRLADWPGAKVESVVINDDEIMIAFDNGHNIHLADGEWCLGRTTSEI